MKHHQQENRGQIKLCGSSESAFGVKKLIEAKKEPDTDNFAVFVFFFLKETVARIQATASLCRVNVPGASPLQSKAGVGTRKHPLLLPPEGDFGSGRMRDRQGRKSCPDSPAGESASIFFFSFFLQKNPKDFQIASGEVSCQTNGVWEFWFRKEMVDG